MPIQSCSQDGKPGWKWGATGTCYTHDGSAAGSKAAKQKAINQALAIGGGQMPRSEMGMTHNEATTSSSGGVAVDRTVWSTAYMNNLPDGSFLYIAPGGSKDSEGKTTPRSLRYFPYKDAGGKIDLPHLRNALSRIPQSNLPASVKQSLAAKAQRLLGSQSKSMPRDGLFRAQPAGLELREGQDGQAGMPTLTGQFAVFNEWTEINSAFEGRFMERIAPGAFTKTFDEGRGRMRVLFEHGKDPQIANKPLGPITELRETPTGASYEVPLIDTAYTRELIPGLEAGLYGSSFRFRVMQEEIDQSPTRSDHNPDGLPERTIKEAKVMEFGPVTFPAYWGATAGLRSITDRFVFTDERAGAVTEEEHPDLEEAVPDDDDVDTSTEEDEEPDTGAAEEEEHPDDDEAASGHLDTGEASSTHAGETRQEAAKMTLEELRAREVVIVARITEIQREHPVGMLPEETQVEWDALLAEREETAKAVKATEERLALVERLAGNGANTVDIDSGRRATLTQTTSIAVGHSGGRIPTDVFDLTQYRQMARSVDELPELYRQGAMRVVDGLVFQHPDADRAKVQAHLERLMMNDGEGRLAQRILLTANPVYQRAWWKKMAGNGLTLEEERVLAIGSQGGNYPVPITLDPTVIMTHDGVVNPIRDIARVETITGNTWNGVASTGVTAAYAAESTEASDNSPTLTQPVMNVEKAQCFVPFSIEESQDWGELQPQIAMMFSEAKDVLEGTQFMTGAGHASNVPQGIITGATATTAASGTGAFAVADLYSLEQALPPRYRARATLIANKYIWNKVRQFDTSGGSALWVQLQAGTPPSVIGYPLREASAMAATTTTGTKMIVMGDFRNYLVVDRAGMNVELIPHLLGSNRRPLGQRGFYAWWRNTAGVLATNAFRVLQAG